MTPKMNDEILQMLARVLQDSRYEGLIADALANTNPPKKGKKAPKGKRAKYEGSGVRSYDRNKGVPSEGARNPIEGRELVVRDKRGTHKPGPDPDWRKYEEKRIQKRGDTSLALPEQEGPNTSPGRKRVANEAGKKPIVTPYTERAAQKLLTDGRSLTPGVMGPNRPAFLKRLLSGKNVAKGVGAIGAGAFLADALIEGLPGIGDAISGQSQKEAVQQALRYEVEQKRQAAKRERLQAQMSLNTARLAQMEPHLYNEVLAGRRLPQGAVVIGGAPRTDLLNELAMGMSTGGFQETSAQDELAALMN